jgi:hypothetical protein
MTITIGERICAAVLAHQLGISTDRAWKLHVKGRELDPSWEEAGETLLQAFSRAGTLPAPAEKINPREVPS